MKNIIIRDPFTFADMTRLFDRFLAEPFPGHDDAPAQPAPAPLAIDIAEDDHGLIVRASLPGFRKEDVSVEVHDGVLTINASRTEEHETKSERVIRRERRTGSVMRSIALPDAVAHDAADAELKDGVLTLRLPKAPEARKRSIAIK